MKVKVVTLCSGYDSQLLALRRLKEKFPKFEFECIGWSDIDDNAIKAHNALFPELADKNLGDMTCIDWCKVEPFDLLTYSTPCLTGDQMILTKDGYKPMLEIKVGDVVLTKSNTWHQVLKKFNNGVRETMLLWYGNGKKVHCTPEHKFLVKILNRHPEFVRADGIYPGDQVGIPLEYGDDECSNCSEYYVDGHYVMYKWYSVKCKEFAEKEQVYDIEVEEDHSYVANGIVCHNCQDVSLAGKRAGFEEGSETRSSILWHTIDAIKVHHPKYLLGENVKGMVTGGNIGLYNKWKLLLESEGYSNFSRVLNAKDYGVPQNRERIFTISILGHDERFYFPKPFKLETRLKDVLDDVVDPQFFLKGDRVKDVIKTISD